MPSESRVPFVDVDTMPRVARGRRTARWSSGVSSAERWLLRAFLGAIGNPAVRLILWSGESICTADAEPVAAVRVNDRRTLLRLMLQSELEFGEAYTDGRLQVDGDLVGLLETIFRAPASRWAE